MNESIYLLYSPDKKLRYFNCQLCKFTREGRFPRKQMVGDAMSRFLFLFPPRGGPFSGKPAVGCFLGVVYWFLSTLLKARIGYAKQRRLPRVLFVSNKTHRIHTWCYIYICLPYKSAIHVCIDTYGSVQWIRHGDGVTSLLRQEHIIDPLVRRKILLEAVGWAPWWQLDGN